MNDKKEKGYYYQGEYWEPTGRLTFLGPEYIGSKTRQKRTGRPPIVLNPRRDRRSINEFYDGRSKSDDGDER